MVGFNWFSAIIGFVGFSDTGLFGFSQEWTVPEDSLDLDIFFRIWIRLCCCYKDVKDNGDSETISTNVWFRPTNAGLPVYHFSDG
jgi:hypothetical protein